MPARAASGTCAVCAAVSETGAASQGTCSSCVAASACCSYSSDGFCSTEGIRSSCVAASDTTSSCSTGTDTASAEASNRGVSEACAAEAVPAASSIPAGTCAGSLRITRIPGTSSKISGMYSSSFPEEAVDALSVNAISEGSVRMFSASIPPVWECMPADAWDGREDPLAETAAAVTTPVIPAWTAAIPASGKADVSF